VYVLLGLESYGLLIVSWSSWCRVLIISCYPLGVGNILEKGSQGFISLLKENCD